MGVTCSCLAETFNSDKEPELFKYVHKKVSATESTLNSVLKIQSH